MGNSAMCPRVLSLPLLALLACVLAGSVRAGDPGATPSPRPKVVLLPVEYTVYQTHPLLIGVIRELSYTATLKNSRSHP